MPPGHDICYRLNGRDEIVFVNDAWNVFASANAGEHLTEARVLGQSLWRFVTDGPTRVLYSTVLARVRDGRSAKFVFRCDSPDCRRLLEMEVAAAPGGLAEFRVRTISEEVRPPQPLLDADRPHTEELLRMCGWCKKVDLGDRWAEVEEAAASLGLFERPLLPHVTHGICGPCYERIAATLSDEGASGS